MKNRIIHLEGLERLHSHCLKVSEIRKKEMFELVNNFGREKNYEINQENNNQSNITINNMMLNINNIKSLVD